MQMESWSDLPSRRGCEKRSSCADFCPFISTYAEGKRHPELCLAGRAHRRSLGFPGFPVGIGGVEELYASFFTESRTRGSVQCGEAENPGSLGMTNFRVVAILGFL